MAWSDNDEDDPWGEEPAWALSDHEDDDNGNTTNGVTNGTTTTTGIDIGNSASLAAHPTAQHILILIDAHRSMCTPCIHNTNGNTNGRSTSSNLISPLDTALAAASHLLHHRIHNVATTKRGKRDGVGIILYNVPVAHNNGHGHGSGHGIGIGGGDEDWEEDVPPASSTLKVLMELSPPGVKEVKMVRSYLPKSLHDTNTNGYNYRDNSQGENGGEGEGDGEDHEERERNLEYELYGIKSIDDNDGNDHTNDHEENENPVSSLRSAIYEANRTFTNAKCVKSVSATSKEREDSKTIWIFTNNDDPCRHSHGHSQSHGHASSGDGANGDGDIDEERRKEEMELVQTAARDVVENEVDLRLLPLPKLHAVTGNDGTLDGASPLPLQPAIKFDKTLFYNQITTVQEEEEEEEIFVQRHGYSYRRRKRSGGGGGSQSQSQYQSQSQSQSQSQTPQGIQFESQFSASASQCLPSPSGNIRKGNSTSTRIARRYNEVKVEVDLDALLERISRGYNKVCKTQTLPLYLPDWKSHKQQPQQQSQPQNSQGGGGGSNSNNNSNSNPGIMLDIYPNIRTRRKPTPTTINARTKKKTIRNTIILDKEQGDLIDPSRLRHYTEFGGRQIPISKKDKVEILKSSIGNSEEASLILLGFKPLMNMNTNIANGWDLQSYPIVDKSMFAYPNEYAVRGSTKAFATLYSSMIRKEVMGIGELLLRVNATSRLVAIVPQREERQMDDDDEEDMDGDGGDDGGDGVSDRPYAQITPPGFLLIPLGYEDDIRAIPENGMHTAEKSLVHAAENIIKNQMIQVDTLSFDNPSLKVFWNYIESVALGDRLRDLDDDDYVDDTQLNVEGILASCGVQIDAFRDALPEDEIEGKKRKVAELVEDTSGIDWYEEFENDTLGELRLDDLKMYLRSVGERVSGRKMDVIDRIKDHIRAKIREVEEKGGISL